MSQSRSRRLSKAAIAATLALCIGGGATAWVLATTNPQLIRGGHAATLGWYANVFPVGSLPAGMAFDGTNLWVSSSTGNSVYKLNASTGAAGGSFATGASPRGVAFDGTFVWVANYNSNTVSKLTTAGVLVGSYPVGTNPQAVVYDGLGYIWVANYTSNNVTKVSTATGAISGTYSVGTGPIALAIDGLGRLWVANYGSNNVTKFELQNIPLVSTNYALAANSGPSALAFDGMNVWVANSKLASVSKINPINGAISATFAMSSAPGAMAFEQGGFSTSAVPNYDPATYIWIVLSAQNVVTRVDSTTGRVVATYPVGRTPNGIVFDGTNIWVQNNWEGTVTQMKVR